MSGLPPRGTFTVQQPGRGRGQGQGRGRGRGGGLAPQNTPAGGTTRNNSPGATEFDHLPWINALVQKGCCRDPLVEHVDDAKTTFTFPNNPRPALVVTGRRVEKLQVCLRADFAENTFYQLKFDENGDIVDIRLTPTPAATPQQGGESSGQR
ncbi:hypothetical protein BDR22DRAFT_894343 [Usnea florida]